MLRLNNDLLVELGLGELPVEDKNLMLTHIYETLEFRVGRVLAARMTDAQHDEFQSFIHDSDETGALAWLQENFPNYKQVVANELGELKDEIREAAPTIVAEACHASASGPESALPGQPCR